MSKIEITDILTSPDYANTIENWLVDFENQNGKGIKREHVSGPFDGMGIYAISDGELIGGLTFRVQSDWVFLCCGFVLPEYRGQKIYSTFIRRIEQMAIEHSLYGLHVCTYTFEAPHVYEHMGFKKGAVLENLPKGNTNIDYYKPINAVAGGGRNMREELIKTLRWVADNDEFVFEAEQARIAANTIESLQSQLAQVTAERDAAVKDIKNPSVCDCCKCACQGDDDCINSEYAGFTWRGPQKED